MAESAVIKPCLEPPLLACELIGLFKLNFFGVACGNQCDITCKRKRKSEQQRVNSNYEQKRMHWFGTGYESPTEAAFRSQLMNRRRVNRRNNGDTAADGDEHAGGASLRDADGFDAGVDGGGAYERLQGQLGIFLQISIGREWDVNNVVWGELDVRSEALEDITIIDDGGLRIGQRTANNEDMVHVSASDGAVGAGDGTGHGETFAIGDGARLGDGAQHIDFARGSRREIDEIVRFQINVLGQIAFLKEPLEIDREQFSLSQHKAVAEVSQFVGCAADLLLLEGGQAQSAAGHGNGLEHGHGGSQRINAWDLDAAHYPNSFTFDAAKDEGDLGSFADEFRQAFFDLLLCLREGQAPDVNAGKEVVIQFSVGSDNSGGAGSGFSDDFNFEFVTRAKSKEVGCGFKPGRLDLVGEADLVKRAEFGMSATSIELGPHLRTLVSGFTTGEAEHGG